MDLSGYSLETLREDSELVLYRGRSHSSNDTILVLAPVSRQADSSHLERFQHECALRGQLDGAWAIQPLRLEACEDRTVLLLRDPGGQPLERQLGRPLTLARFLDVAVGLTSALRQVHAQGLIHKDIKPGNIFVDEAGTVRLTGFGRATRMPRERQAPAVPETMAGTLAYMAPEQTGRINRSIDSRTDLYSLGVTLYEMLVGALPFSASKPMEWIYNHIARIPPPPSVRVEGVPPPLDAILLKLLAKNAEDRYQTAVGVEHDLQRCQTAFRAGLGIDAFPLASRDWSDQLRIPERLYGREKDLAQMAAARDRVATRGNFEFLLVSGSAGVGKSALVNELRSAIHPTRGAFAAGKFDRHRQHIPYATLIEVFQGLLRQILSQSDSELDKWRTSLESAIGLNGALLVDLFPELAKILGVQPALLGVSTQEAKNRFHFVFRRFVAAFARPQNPLIVFLDDLQWLDAATLELLRALIAEEDISNLLLIGAYRLNEPEPTHDLKELLVLLGMEKRGVQQIELAPLTPDDICSLVAEVLHTDKVAAAPVADAVFGKTHGNPFFATQLLVQLNAEQLIWLDPANGAWQWDLQGIQSKGITDDVAQLMAERLVSIQGTALEAIKKLSCLSDAAKSLVLSRVLDLPEDTVGAAMRGFVASGLIHKVERGYLFAHDGLREAAYALIPEPDRASVHLQLARLLLNGRAPKEIEEDIFEVVHQFNRGASLITEKEELQKLAELNLTAGKRAAAAAAHASALTYLEAGCALLTTDRWGTLYRVTFELELCRAECRFMLGDIGFAEERLALLADHSAQLSDLTLIVSKQVILYTYMGKMERAIDLSLACLARLNVSLPLHPTDEDLADEYEQVRARIEAGGIEQISQAPALEDPDWQYILGIFEGLISPAGTINPDLHALVVMRMVNIGLKHGVSNESAHSYSNLGGQVLGWRFGTFEEGRQFGQLALRMVDRGFSRYAARIYAVVSGTVGIWMLPFRECYELAVRATNVDRAQGGIIYSGYAWATGLSALFSSGAPLAEVHKFAETGLAFAERSGFSLLVECINPVRFLVRALRGMTKNFASFSDAELQESDHEQYLATTPHLWHGLVRFRIRKLQLQYWCGNFANCLSLALILENDVPVLKVLERFDYLFFVALARAAALTSTDGESRAPLLAALRLNYAELTGWASLYPVNFMDRTTLVGAEIARLEGRELDAERLYEEAVLRSREAGLLHMEALAFELSARFYAARGFAVTAEAYLRNARYCYVRWGAEGKVRQLDEQHRYLREDPSTRLTDSLGSGAALQNLDVAAIIDMYHAITGEIVFERLIERLMVTVVQYAGAVRGVLLLPREGSPDVVAEAAVSHEGVGVSIHQHRAVSADVPQSVVNYVLHTHEFIILGDASVASPHSSDPYVRRTQCRSVLCLPLMKQKRCLGVLYLENGLSSHIFTPERVSVLQLVASQAAISIENAALFSNLRDTQDHARRVNEELQRSFDMIPALAWRAAPDGTMEAANKRWVDYTGVSQDQTRSRTWLREFHPEDIEKVREKWRHLSSFRTSGEFEARMRRFDGEFRSFLVRVTPTVDADGNVLNWHGTHTDIDDLKQAQDSLRKSEAALAEGQRISHTGSWAWSSATDMVSWSEECARIFGCSEGQRQVPYALMAERIHPEDRAYVEVHRAKATGGREDYSVEHRIVLPDGTTKTVLHRGRHIGGGRGHAVEYVGTVLDVTEQRKNESRVREAQAALSQVARLTALGELTASIAHEVSQPLMSIVTNAATCLQWLEEDQTDTEAARTAAKRIIRDGKRAGDVINSIRALAKKAPPKMAQLDLNAAILEVLLLTKSELERHSIAWHADLSAEATRAVGDRVQVQQVILNLVINAIEAMQGTHNQPRRLTVQSMREDAQTVVVSVCDTGVGVEGAGNEKIFEAFYTTKADGLGIGLSTCRSIVEAHKGRLWASANVPHGAAFHFTLPIHRE
jgi:PAS domain S-box-containing protein